MRKLFAHYCLGRYLFRSNFIYIHLVRIKLNVDVQGSEEAAVEKLRQLEVNGSSTLRKYESKAPSKETRSKATTNQLLVCIISHIST